MALTGERSYTRKGGAKYGEKFGAKAAPTAPPPKVKYEDLPRLPRDRALAAHAQAIARGARCDECPLLGLRAGPIQPTIVPNARLAVINEAPYQQEVDEQAFCRGKVGDAVNDALLAGGLVREEVTMTGVLLCRPPEEMRAFEFRLKVAHDLATERARAEGQPEPLAPLTPATCCLPRLQRDLEDTRAPTILAFSGMALRAVADIWAVPFGSSKKVRAGEVRIASIKKQLGSPLTLPDGTIMVATYPPSFGMRPGSRQYAHVIREHIARAAKIAVRGYIDWHEPDYILDPSVDQIEATLERMTGKDKIIDIETDKGTRADGSFDPMTCRIRCIGFGSIVDGRELVIAVPLRKMNGEEWWEPEDKKRVVLACMKALNDYSVDATTGEQARLVGHNMAFDTSVLLRFRLMLDRDAPFEDTILMHHDTADNDLPHDLGFVTSRYFEVPSWKSGADDKYYDQVTDHDLHLYNCRDIVSTMRIFYHL